MKSQGNQCWYEFVYRIFRPVLDLFLPRKFNYEYKNIDVPRSHSPYIVISNHITFWDPLFVAISFKKQQFFVSSDQVMRAGIGGKLIRFLVNPIVRVKSQNETQTVISIFKRLRQSNIVIFSEGTISYDGETKMVMSSTGKLVKRSGASLVTFRISGGYFTYPRWARFHRKGKMTGKLVNIYSAEQLKAMTPEEINEQVYKDIYVNAYEDQEKEPIAYKGKKLAEHLETALYCCPQCKEFSTLTSNDDRFFCKCGFHVRYTEYGYFEYPQQEQQDKKPPFTTILEWCKWQQGIITDIVNRINDLDVNTPIFTDHNQDLYLVTRAKKGDLQASGTLHLYVDRLSLVTAEGKEINYPLDTINDTATFANSVFIFSTKEKQILEIKSEHPTCVIKYMEMFKLIRGAAKES